LDILVGYTPNGAKRTAPQGGDSPLGNLIASAMWLRLGIQTDFSLTNTTGIRADLNPGPITIEEMYNIFPFDHSISKMQLSGAEQIYIGHTQVACSSDQDCADPDGTVHPGQCDKPAAGQPGLCQSLITPTNLYELATSNYLAGGGSGYRVLQRNTTQFDTQIQ